MNRCPSVNQGRLCRFIWRHVGDHQAVAVSGVVTWANLEPGILPRLVHSEEGHPAMPQRYRKIPVEVEAIQCDGTPETFARIFHWVEANTEGAFDYVTGRHRATGKPVRSGVSVNPANGRLVIANDGESAEVVESAWVIREPDGAFTLCSAAAFDSGFEKATGHAEVFKDSAGKWRYRIVAGNGRITEQSQAYVFRSSAVKGARRGRPDIDIRKIED